MCDHEASLTLVVVQAFRALALKLHPDKNRDDPDAGRLMPRLRVLSHHIYRETLSVHTHLLSCTHCTLPTQHPSLTVCKLRMMR